LTIQEKIRILLVRRGNMSEAELSRRLEKTPQNFHRKMKAGKFTNADLEKIAAVLDCTVTHTEPVFKMNDTGEEL
jgi:IS30 family transposase